jgi:hypothetical protein
MSGIQPRQHSPSLSSRTFLAALFDNAPPTTLLLLWTLPDRRSRFFAADRLDAAAAYAVAVGSRADVYVGCGLRGRDHGPRARGESADVVGIPGAWADLDVAKPGATKPYFATRAAITTFLDALPIGPTLRVDSGSGLHCYWLFKEGWIFADAADRAKAAALLRAWQRYIRLRAEHVGATIDATHDVSRILRPPGTTNHKYGVPVVLETTDGPRCDPAELADLADIVEDDPVDGVAGQVDHGGIALDPNANPPADEFRVLCIRHPRFARTWRRERDDLHDQSASGFDQALASIAARDGWSDQAIVDLLVAHRRRHGDALKRVDYYIRTLRRARMVEVRG